LVKVDKACLPRTISKASAVIQDICKVAKTVSIVALAVWVIRALVATREVATVAIAVLAVDMEVTAAVGVQTMDSTKVVHGAQSRGPGTPCKTVI
jgi:hypothetical protein